MRKKKYFIGGVVNQGIQGVTQDMPDNSGKIIGGAAQFGIGAATGNPQDMIGGGIGMLSGGFNNAKEMFNNKDANFMDKALAAYGVINPIAGVASSFRNKALTERQQQDDVMNNIIKQNNMMANGGNLPPSEFQQYRNPYGNLQPLQNTLPYTPHPLDLEAIPPQRYNPFTPMEGITQPISNEPIDIENQWAKLPRNILDPTNKIYEMFSTNNYSGVPTSVNNNTGRQYSLSDLSGARNEQKRNQDILNYLTQSKQTAQEIQNHKQQHPEYFVDPGTYAGNLQSYLTSEAGQNKLSEALGDFDNINLGQRTTNPTYHAEGGMLNRFDGGFTHNDPSAQNSFEGIPIARGDNGETHVVENGEASLPTPDGNQYIFSDQNKLTKNLAKQLNIANKYVGKTFAQIAKSYEDNTRKGDPLDEKTFDLNIRNLMAANEQAKQISEIGKVYKMAKGGKLNINKYYTDGPIGTIAPDNRNFIERWGDRLYQSYTENKPALFQDFPITDIFDPFLSYITGNTPQQYDMEGNPISSGVAPTIGFKNMPYNKSINRTIPKQTYTKTGKAAFTKGAPRATHTKKPVGDFDLNYDPLQGGRKASPETIAQRKAATRAKNLEKARAAKNEKAYQKLLDESGNAKSGVNIPEELEGTVDFGKTFKMPKISMPNISANTYSNIGRNVGQAGVLAGGIYGLSQIDRTQDVSNNANINNVYGTYQDYQNILNRFKQPGEVPQIPYRYSDELDTTLTMDNANNINNVNNNKQVITDNALPYNADFFDPSSPSLPYNTPSHTRRGYYGNNLQDQNAWIKTQLTPENINNWINPESPLNKDVDWRQNLIKEIQTKQPKLYNALLNGEVPEDKLIELYVESENGPIQSLVTSPYEHMVRRDVKLKNPDPILEIPKKSTTTKDEEETPTKNPPNLPNLWPELGLAGNLGAMAMLDPTYMTPSTMSTGYQDYNPLDVNKSDIAGNVSNMIAGMGASGNPYNILASGLQGMKGLDSAQQQANIYNLQDRSNVDARNIGVQDVVGARNLQYLNQANAMNTGIANQTNRELADTFASAVGNYSGAGNDRYYSNQGADFWGRATGYDPRTAQYLLAMQNNNKPVEETKASAYGGIIKTRKRKLK